MEQAFDKEENALKLSALFGLNTVYFQYQDDNVNIRSKNFAFQCDLNCTGGKRVMWMKDRLGVDGFIREGGENDRIF